MDTNRNVSEAIWRWQAKPSGSKAHHVSRTPLFIGCAAGTIIAGVFFYSAHLKMAAAIFGITLFLLCCGLFLPALYAKIQHLFVQFSRLVGIVLTWLLLVPFYFCVFPFGRAMQKLKAKDPMNRSLSPGQFSYWVERERSTGKNDYTRQF